MISVSVADSLMSPLIMSENYRSATRKFLTLPNLTHYCRLSGLRRKFYEGFADRLGWLGPARSNLPELGGCSFRDRSPVTALYHRDAVAHRFG